MKTVIAAVLASLMVACGGASSESTNDEQAASRAPTILAPTPAPDAGAPVAADSGPSATADAGSDLLPECYSTPDYIATCQHYASVRNWGFVPEFASPTTCGDNGNRAYKYDANGNVVYGGPPASHLVGCQEVEDNLVPIYCCP